MAMQNLRELEHFKRDRLDAEAKDVAVEYSDQVDEDQVFALPNNVVDAQIQIGHIQIVGEDSDGKTLYQVTPRAKRKLDDALEFIREDVDGRKSVLQARRRKNLTPLAFADRISPTGKWYLADIGPELTELERRRNAERPRTSQSVQTSDYSIQFIGSDPENPMDTDNLIPSSTQDSSSHPISQTTTFTSLDGVARVPSSVYPTPSPSNRSPGDSSHLPTSPPLSPTPQPSGFEPTTPSNGSLGDSSYLPTPPSSSPTPQPSRFGTTTLSDSLDPNTELQMPGGFPETPSPTLEQLVCQLESALSKANSFNGALTKEIEEYKRKMAILCPTSWRLLFSASSWRSNFERSQNEHAVTKKALGECEARKKELESQKSVLEKGMAAWKSKYDNLLAWYTDHQKKAVELARQQMNLLSGPPDLTAI